MKKFLSLLLVTLLFVGVMAHHAFAEDTSLADIQAKGTLVLGLDDTFPPMGFRDENTNEIIGYDIDLAAEVAARLGVELVCQPIDWAAKEWSFPARTSTASGTACPSPMNAWPAWRCPSPI